METYEDSDGQMAFDTSLESDRSLMENVNVAIDFACRQTKAQNPDSVKNRHDGYGIAAEYYIELKARMKAIDLSMKAFLASLGTDDDSKAVDAASSLKNSATQMSVAAIQLTAQADKIATDLYEKVSAWETPLEELSDSVSDDSFEGSSDSEESEPNEAENGAKEAENDANDHETVTN